MTFSPYYNRENGKNESRRSTSSFKTLITWVNSIEYPNCLLASDIRDFRDGVILCELINEIVLKNQQPDFLPRIKNQNPNYADILRNIEMALDIIRSQVGGISVPKQIMQLTHHDVANEDENIIILLEHLYNISHAMSHSTRDDDNQTDKHSASHYTSNHQRQLTADFGSDPKMEHNIEYYPINGTRKPPIGPTLAPLKNAKSLNDLSSGSKQTWPQSITKKMDLVEPNAPSANICSKGINPNEEVLDYNSYQNSFRNQNFKDSLQTYEANLFYVRNSPSKFDQSPSFLSAIPHTQDQNNSEILVNDFLPGEKTPPRKDRTSDPNTIKFTSNSSNPKKPQSNFIRDFPAVTSRDIHETEYSPLKASEQYSKLEELDREDHHHQMLREYEYNQSHGTDKKDRPAKSKLDAKTAFCNKEIQKDQTTDKNRQNVKTTNDQKGSQKIKGIMKSSSIVKGLPNQQYPENKSVSRPLSSRDRSEEHRVILTPVTNEIKFRLFDWLCSINLLKERSETLIAKLHKICKHGIIFADLINRLEGKHDVIKGIERASTSRTTTISNYIKLMDYLKKFEKMNPRYLHAQIYLMDGNEDVFWGLLDDIYHLYYHKISPHDLRYRQETRSKRSPIPTSRTPSPYFEEERRRNSNLNKDSISRRGILLRGRFSDDRNTFRNSNKRNGSQGYINSMGSDRQSHDSRNQYRSNSHDEELDRRNEDLVNENNIKDSGRLSSRWEARDSYSELHTKRTSICNTNRSNSPNLKSSRISAQGISRRYSIQKENKAPQDSKSKTKNEEDLIVVDIETENIINEWLIRLGLPRIPVNQNLPLFEDSLRNGFLLVKLLERLKIEKINKIYHEPKSIDECRYNVYTVFRALSKNAISIPSFLKGKEEAILKGNRSIVLSLLFCLKELQSKKENLFGATNSNIDEHKTYIPPCSEKDIKLLEESLLCWMIDLKLINGHRVTIRNFKDLIEGLKDGVLLCSLVSTILKENHNAIHKKPTSELHCISNIRKALEGLRKRKNMGQRYLWKEKEIYDGSRYIILGLLQDIHQFTDGVKPRASYNYYLEGLYIPEGSLHSTERRLSFNTTETERMAKKDSVSTRFGNANQNHDPALSDVLRDKGNNERSLVSIRVGSTLNSKNDVNRSGLHFEDHTLVSQRQSRSGSIHNQANEPEGLPNTISSKNLAKELQNQVPHNNTRKFSCSSTAVEEKRDSVTAREAHEKNYQHTGSISSRRSSVCSAPQNINVGIDSQIKKWLTGLNLGILVKDINFEAKRIEKLRDGVLFAKIFEELKPEKSKYFIFKPAKKDDHVVNIKRCLEIVSKNPKIRPQIHDLQEKLLFGDGEAIREFLQIIKAEYSS